MYLTQSPNLHHQYFLATLKPWYFEIQRLLSQVEEPDSSALLSTFQDPQWMPLTTDSTKPYMYYDFAYQYIPITKFNL